MKCSRHVWLGGTPSEQIFTTGFSKMRDRELSLFDTRNAGSGSAIKTQRLDSNTGVLMPVVDQERNIVYMAGRVSFTAPSFFSSRADSRLRNRAT
jgi:coronin-7